MSEHQSNRGDWHRLARKVSTKINLAWWLDKLAVPLVVTTLLGSCLILLARRELPQFPWMETAILGGVLLLAMGLMAWWFARRHFETPEKSMVRMEASMMLRNGLSAAREGVTPSQALPNRIDDGTRWRWSRLVVPMLAAGLFIAASILLPVSAKDPDAGPLDEPQAWKDLQADIEALDHEDTVQEQYLEELEERLEELRSQQEEQWFSHSSLEATDALKKMHGAELENLERNLRKAERALNALQKHGGQMGEAAQQRLLNEFDQALQNMGQGKMKPNQALLDQLKQLDPKNLGQLDQEQLDQLRQNMKRQAQNCEDCQGGGQGQGQGQAGGEGQDWLDELLEEGENGPGDGEGNGPGNPGQNPGKGGINRGPGTAPGVLGQLGGDVKTGDLKGLESDDLTRSLPGDLLELADGEHEIDKAKVGIRTGGGVENEGKGGDRIWKDALLPSEKKALKEFFK